jgi:predicted XRE-type DNA-binding protein
MTPKIPIHPSSGNVFADMGFPPAKAAHLLVRSDLMIAIERELKRRKLIQKEAAKLLGVTQPRVSALLRHRIDLFSLDTLIDMAERLGIEVTLETKSRAAADELAAEAQRLGLGY